ncbi:MAG TPA: FtsH protease activity modulator HflK, partial [Stellaceae bacterium]|nr:FtsH protease activity modulator HflK [Stellaceae bacterium]
MPWSDKPGGSGGPWGGGGNGQGPWGGRGPSGGGRPPNIEDLTASARDWLRRLFSGGSGGGKIIIGILAVIVLLWAASGFYRVLPDEQGVVLRFGGYSETTQPGLHYHLPTPIEEVLTPSVTTVRFTNVGFDQETGRARDLPEESLMLTGDENIIDINLQVQWLVKDARAYLFNIRDPERTVKSASESAIREVIGHTAIAAAMAEGRHQVETDTQSLLQTVLDSYGAGVQITQVQLQKADPPEQVLEAFRDVQRARTDKESLTNEAEAYSNDVVPKARGEAQQIIQDAQAYKAQVVAKAHGDADRFTSVL